MVAQDGALVLMPIHPCDTPTPSSPNWRNSMTLRNRLYLARFQRFAYITMLCTLAFNIVFLANLYAERNPPQGLTIYPAIPNPGRFLIPDKYKLVVMTEAANHGIPLDIAIRLVYEESRWKESAINRNTNGTYDYGLMQLNSRYFKVYPWQTNIQKGLEYLASLYIQTGTWKQALISYNAGLNGGKNPKERSIRYAERIVSGGL